MNIVKTLTQVDLEILIATATERGANCALVKPEGKRGHVYSLEKLPGFLGSDFELIFGRRIMAGLPFTPLPAIVPVPELGVTVVVQPQPVLPPVLKKVEPVAPAVPPVVKKSKFKKPRKVKASAGPTAPRGSGFIALIDSLLKQVVPGKVEGYVRSKFTVDEAVGKIMAAFPNKNAASVKRIVKVRPRHLERIKTGGLYDEKTAPAPRWRWVGPGAGSGYMRRIDELIDVKDPTKRLTTKQVAEIVVKEFGKDLESALKVVRMRTSQFETKHLREPGFKRVQPKGRSKGKQKSDRVALIAKNKALFAAGKKKKK